MSASDDKIIICSGNECRMIKKGDPIPAGFHIQGSEEASSSSASSKNESSSSAALAPNNNAGKFLFSSLLGPKLIRKKGGSAAGGAEWECAACTFKNKASDSVCDACEQPKPSTGKGASSAWSCPSCTYQNKSGTNECEMCGGANSTSAESSVEYEEVATDDYLNGKFVGLYFSAHWCGPCRMFTPQLSKFYQEFRSTDKGKNFEIIFVSSDRDAAAFDEYFGTMPWTGLPFKDRERKSTLSQKYKVQGIPTLVILHPNGSTATTDARSSVTEDPTGTNFPWAPLSFWDIFEKNPGKIIDNKKNETTINELKENDLIGVYFSAHWCPPCKGYTPQLVTLYNKIKGEGKKFQIIFCSSDRDESSFEHYHGTMPWLALPLGDKRIRLLSRKYGIEGIPSLVLIDPSTGNTVNASARGIVSEPDGFPWKPKPLAKLGPLSASMLNERPIAVLLSKGSDAESSLTSFTAVATKHFNSFNNAGQEFDDHPIVFLYVNDPKDAMVERLSNFLGLPASDNSQLFILHLPARAWFGSKKSIDENGINAVIEAFLNEDESGAVIEAHPIEQ